VFAATLVNINTADLATLETLSGIGPSKAQAIITYRTNNGPFAVIDDIMNVSGIGPATFDTIKAYITVSDTAPAQTQTQTQTDSTSTATQTQTQVATTAGGVGPPAITAQITTDTTGTAGAGTAFTGAVFGTTGVPLSGARYMWNFGDGATGEGAHALHTYAYPGTYDVELSVGYNYSSATARVSVLITAPQVALVLESDNSLTVANKATTALSVGGWSLSNDGHTFIIPQDTIVRAQEGLRFAPSVMGFAGSRDATLQFSNGTLAAAAGVAGDSPLRGQRVALASATPAAGKATIAAVKAPPQPAVAAADNQTAAAALAGPIGDEVQWSYFVGLAAIIALGAVGAYYAQSRPVPVALETEGQVDEFEIE